MDEQNSAVLKHLRSGKFLTKLEALCLECDDNQFLVHIMVAYIVNCFAPQNWEQSQAKLVPSIVSRLTSASNSSDKEKVYKDLLATVVTNGQNDIKIRNLNVFRLTLRIAQESKDQL